MTPRRWQPTTQQELQQGIDEGLLKETHYLEVKREVGDTDAKRKETARDLASFAKHGGAVIIGVEEDKPNHRWVLTPQLLEGLVERLELIAANRIDPPLYLRITEIPSTFNHLEGFLFVEVPPSTQAPHMVEGTYFGRGEKTRRRLSDPEVTALHQARTNLQAQAGVLLDHEIARNPIRDQSRRCGGHLYLVAQPVNAPSRIARSSVRGNGDAVSKIIKDAEPGVPGRIAEHQPGVSFASVWVPRANGGAFCSSTLRNARSFSGGNERQEASMVDIEFREDGGIRALIGGFTRRLHEIERTQEQFIFDGLAVAYSFRLIGWAAGVAAAHEYRGSWMFGLAADGVHGRSAWRTDPWFAPPQFDAEEYRSITTATTATINDRPHEIAEHLTGALLHALDHYDAYEAHFTN
ncbi:hypothetical protein GCM10009853_010300 [Glycomyces scopariae]